jgi:hypothetical protein
MEKKLYGLRTSRGDYDGSVIVQVSFNKQELEEIAAYLNKNIKYYLKRAEVVEITESNIEWYWPHGNK